MIRIFFILSFSILLLFTACSTNKQTTSIHFVPLFVAWNEDTINSYQLTLFPNTNFYYAIAVKEGNLKQVKSFKGTFKFSGDSILLNYDRALYQVETTDYIIKEASGNYLIQYFTNDSERMFLRIQPISHYR
jgi:hypothetical protein